MVGRLKRVVCLRKRATKSAGRRVCTTRYDVKENLRVAPCVNSARPKPNPPYDGTECRISGRRSTAATRRLVRRERRHPHGRQLHSQVSETPSVAGVPERVRDGDSSIADESNVVATRRRRMLRNSQVKGQMAQVATDVDLPAAVKRIGHVFSRFCARSLMESWLGRPSGSVQIKAFA